MKKIVLAGLLLLILAGCLFSLKAAHAASFAGNNLRLAATTPPSIKDITLPKSKYSDLGSLLSGVATWIIGFAGAFATIAVVYSGIMYITAAGDEAKAETAKKNLTWAILGVVVAILAILIINNIIPILAGTFK